MERLGQIDPSLRRIRLILKCIDQRFRRQLAGQPEPRLGLNSPVSSFDYQSDVFFHLTLAAA